jgi:hypothetical protein
MGPAAAGLIAMAARTKRPRPGDLLRVQVDDGAALLHYLGKHPEYGDAVRVLRSDSFPQGASDREALLATGYVTFYPLMAAARQGLVSVVGHCDSTVKIPATLRRPGWRGKDGTVHAWVIEHDGRDVLTRSLTEEQRALPIAAIWNHEMLCLRIREGWRPETDGRNPPQRVVTESRSATGGDEEAVVLHYLYFPTRQAADSAAGTLRNDAEFSVESRLGADGVNWLVLARHRIVPEEAQVERKRAMFEDLARRGHGEYDGWEAEVG